MDIYSRKIWTIFIYNSQDKCPLVDERIKTGYTNTHTHTHSATLLSQKMKEILPFVRTWMDIVVVGGREMRRQEGKI